jgi:hypothetical protein
MDNHPFFCCEEDFENVKFEMVKEWIWKKI